MMMRNKANKVSQYCFVDNTTHKKRNGQRLSLIFVLNPPSAMSFMLSAVTWTT
jgi:hypothetical protein